ncbi:Long-chain acyl-CoA thioesterase FadM [compost metagenome]|uniref:Acyl-CoA thioesterase FadM n=1 Tax=Pseudomonas jinjuensis TaxID=198616 RepID=A0A1G9YWX7_9PSED|nr:thioesterase family protein [Pseudomonas jinjuensis]SDN12913.1 Acyl-CoA thioesterase FadM [Pseudomonas jinjuensis]
MARLTLEFPEHLYCYHTVLTVRTTDINGGGHLGNDAMISMISEARARFLYECHITEGVDANGIGYVATDLATTYRAEAFARDKLRFDMGMMDLNKYGGDIVFRVTRIEDGKLIAMAKTGFVFFDYRARKVVPIPEEVRKAIPAQANWLA